MFARKLAVVTLLGSVTLLLFTGCFATDERTQNQGGSDPIQATTKLLSDQLGTMNPDDVQVLADLTTQIGGTALPQVTDVQAQAVIDFMKANNINTIEDVQKKIDQAQTNPNSIVIPDDVKTVLEGIIANPAGYQSFVNGLGT